MPRRIPGRWRAGVLALLSVLCARPVRSADAPEFFLGREAAPREVLVRFRSHDEQAFAAARRDHDLDVLRPAGGAGLHRAHSRSRSAAQLIRELSARPDVEYAEPNYIVQAVAAPNDPSYGLLWGLHNTGQVVSGATGKAGADIGAEPAWDVATGAGSGVAVGIVDTGVDYTHPDLAANIWSAPAAFTVKIGGVSLTCPAGSHGYNAITNTCNPMDDNQHGTHVAGTIGAVGSNGAGVAGVNWGVTIIAAKFLNRSGSGSLADAIDAVEFLIQAKQAFPSGANVRVLSNSWGGGGFSQAMLDEINRAGSNGMLFVAAAGNNGTSNDSYSFYPAGYKAPNVVAVAATDNQDARASFSNYGPTTVHLGAPGVNIYSTVLNGKYAYLSGTSMATPHVSGAAALVLSHCGLDTAGVKANLLANVDVLPTLQGRTVSGGRLNLNRSVRSCTPASDFSVSASPASQSVVAGSAANYTVAVATTGGFTGAVALTASGLPSGATATFTPASVNAPGSSALAVTTSGSTPLGTYALTLQGASGGATQTAAASLTVTAPPDFSVSASPASRTVAAGSAASYTVTVATSGGFSGAVALTASGLPSGATATFSPASVNGPGSSALAITTSGSTPLGTYALTLQGASGGVTHTAAASFTVAAAPDFSVSATPASRTVAPGSAASYTVTVAATGGFSGAVALTATGLPSGAAASFTPASINGPGSSALAVTPSGSTPPGTYTLTITGAGAGLTRSASVTLTVSGPAPDFSLSATPASQSVPSGTAAAYTVTVSAAAGFSGSVALRVSGLPPGTSASFSPASITGPDSAVLQVLSSRIFYYFGTVPLRITGDSGGLQRTASVSLTLTPPTQTRFQSWRGRSGL